MAIADIVKDIAVTAELTQASLSAQAVAVMAADLRREYEEDAIHRALARCRREMSRPLTPGAVFDRLREDDGRPTSDEAWAIALKSTDEAETVVLNAEIQHALAAARPILEVGDKVGARMAFRDAYDKIVRLGREGGLRPIWFASLGWDSSRQAIALQAAQQNGLLSEKQVANLLPAPKDSVVGDALFNGMLPKAEAGPDGERVRSWIRRIKADLRARNEAMAEKVRAAAEAERHDFLERKRKAAELVENGLREKAERVANG